MLDHVIHARMEWEACTEQILVAVDFQKAYDSVSFDFLRTAQGYIWLPNSYIGVLMSVIAGRILFCVGGGGVTAPIRHTPRGPTVPVAIQCCHDFLDL